MKTKGKCQFLPTRMAKFWRTDTKCWQACRAAGCLTHCPWECKMVCLLWRTCWPSFFNQTYTYLDLAILPLDIYWEVKTFDHKENCLEPNTGRSSGTHQRNGYTKLGRVVRWDMFDSTKTRTNTAVGSAKNIMLTESRHIQKSTYRLIPSLWNSRTDKINLWRKKKSEVVAWGVGRCAVGTDWGGAWENFLGWR